MKIVEFLFCVRKKRRKDSNKEEKTIDECSTRNSRDTEGVANQKLIQGKVLVRRTSRRSIGQFKAYNINNHGTPFNNITHITIQNAVLNKKQQWLTAKISVNSSTENS